MEVSAACEHALMFVLARERLVISCDIGGLLGVSSLEVEIVLHLLAPRDVCTLVWRKSGV